MIDTHPASTPTNPTTRRAAVSNPKFPIEVLVDGEPDGISGGTLEELTAMLADMMGKGLDVHILVHATTAPAPKSAAAELAEFEAAQAAGAAKREARRAAK
jgi:hypothetical protein